MSPLLQNKWIPRRVDNNPKTIDQIHREVEQEAQEKAFLAQQAQLQQKPNRGKAISLWFNSLLNDKILEVTKFKVFADDKVDVAKRTTSLFDRVENSWGKGENADYQHLLVSPQCIPKTCSLVS